MERGGGRAQNPSKLLEDSSMTHEESEYMSFWVSQLEGLVKGFVSKRDLEKSMDDLKGDLDKRIKGSMTTLNLFNLEERLENKLEECMGHMGHKMEKNMQSLVMLI